jgi:hypothetical protein
LPRRFPPERIVCLTEETVETLYLLGEQQRIVGVSGYAVRPPQVRREKPRVSAFTSANIPKILALDPDLIFTFSDFQRCSPSLCPQAFHNCCSDCRCLGGLRDRAREAGSQYARCADAFC